MAAVNLHPVIITVLLLALSYSKTYFFASAAVFAIATAATYACCRLQVQLHLESAICYIVQARKQISRRFLRSSSCVSETVQVKNESLQSLPTPIANILGKFIDAVLRDFVESWYTSVGPGEKEFVSEVRVALEHIARETFMMVRRTSIRDLTADLIRMLHRHIKTFNECKDAVNRKYPGISDADLETCISELYDVRILKHIATTSKGAEIDYLKTLLDMFLFRLVPCDLFLCESGRFMLREILAVQLLEPLARDLTDSHFINTSLVDLLEPGVPLEIVIDMYQKEMYRTDREYGERVLPEDGHPHGPGISCESSHKDSETCKSDYYKTSLCQSYVGLCAEKDKSGVELAGTDALVPGTSKAFLESDSGRNLNQEVVFSNLEAQSYEPANGSSSVRLLGKSKPPLHMPMPSNFGTSVHTGASRSSKFSEAVVTEAVASDELCSEPGHQIPSKGNVGDLPEPKVLEFNDLKDGDVSCRRTEIDSQSWAFCPSSSARLFLEDSFSQMPRVQDKPKERVKAKLKFIGEALTTPASCYQPCTSSPVLGSDANDLHELPRARSITTAFLDQTPGYSCDASDTQIDDPATGVVILDDVPHADISNDIVQVHSSGLSGAFYEFAPSCPTCLAMTSMSGGFVKGKPVVIESREEEASKSVTCGLSTEPCCDPEKTALPEQADSDSFASCPDVETGEGFGEDASSSETLLSSLKSDNAGVTSLKSQLVGDIFEGNDYDVNEIANTSSLRESSCDDLVSIGSSVGISSWQLITRHSKRQRTRSMQTFKSAIELSSSEIPSTPLLKTGSKDGNLFDYRRREVLRRTKLSKVPETNGGVLASRHSNLNSNIRNRLRSTIEGEKFENPSRLKSVGSLFSIIVGSDLELGNKVDDEILDKPVCVDDDVNVEPRSLSSEVTVSSLSTSQNFTSVLGSSLLRRRGSGGDMFMSNLIEEVGAEAIEADQCVDEVEDARYPIYSSSSDGDLPFDLRTIAAHDDCSRADGQSVVSFKSVDSKRYAESKETSLSYPTEQGDVFPPMCEGEIIAPRPSKKSATAWLYPGQMISVAGTKLAYEKGWEPDINKYTLYTIHYDVRIWPDLCSALVTEDAHAHTAEPGQAADEKSPLSERREIREVKRRYREFLLLHNRLMHGPMSAHMKGIRRPNRRYSMPFDRMDPDVIEGRRKILEKYLVSIVSRPELCNSREFKEFLGAETHDSFSSDTLLKNETNELVADVRTMTLSVERVPSNNGLRDAEMGPNYEFFIRGYGMPRMFGYADNASMNRHLALWLAHFVDTRRCDVPSDRGQPDGCQGDVVMAKFEFVQKPKPYAVSADGDANVDVCLAAGHLYAGTDTSSALRTGGDGAEDSGESSSPRTSASSRPAAVRLDHVAKRHNGRCKLDDKSIQIAALFSDELAAQLHEEKNMLGLSKEKDLSQSSWPITESMLSLLCEILRGYNSWLTFKKVQKAILLAFGGVFEWLLARKLEEIVMKERWFQYLTDLFNSVWDGDVLRPRKPTPTAEQRKEVKDEALRRLVNVLPSFIMMSVGPSQLERCCEQLLNTVQYQRINKHVLYAALEIVLLQLAPEMLDCNPAYLKATGLANSTGSRVKPKRKT